MGPVRHRLINLLSIVVVLQLAVALVALSARSGMDIGSKKGDARSAAEASSTRKAGGVLAAGNFTKRRGSKSNAADGTAAKSTSTTGPSVSTTPARSTAEAPVQATTSTTSPSNTAPATTNSTTSIGTPSPTVASLPPPGGVDEHTTLSDPVGDTTVDGDGAPITESRADIVRTGAAYGPAGITFVMQVRQPTDPRLDQRWAGDSTYATWTVDTNGDAAPDYEIDYFLADGQLGGSVSRPGDDGESVCDAAAVGYVPDGYTVTIDPACIGGPASFSYRAAIYYDTNPADENADVASDAAPNGGWSFPIRNSG